MATNNKYDRQLRLWGSGGQKALSETCIVLIRATAAGTETLKNLILPGIGAYLILDDVCLDDSSETMTTVPSNTEYQSNFFLTKESTTTATTSAVRTRAQCACELLQELNPDVSGSWKHFDTIHNNNNNNNTTLLTFDYLSFFHNTIVTNSSNNNSNNTDMSTSIKNIVVIGSDLEPDLLETISRVCSLSSSNTNPTVIPFIGVFSYGLIGIVKIQVPVPLPIIDTKTRDTTPDLRLQYPMTGLLQLMDQLDTDTNNDWSQMTNIDHGHIPYPIILLRCMTMWKKQHNDTIPTTYHEKQEFQKTIQQLARNYDMELNFQEAVKYAYLIYSSSKVIDLQHVQTLQTIAKQYCNCSMELKKFYYMISAFILFLKQRSNIPPLNGTIPDMVTSTDLYIKLQTIYKEQSTMEWNEMKSYLNQVIQQENENNASNNMNDVISDDELVTFCQNVYTLDLLSTGTFWDHEYAANDDNSSEHEKICTELAIAMDDAADDVDNQNGNEMDDDIHPYHHNQLPLLWYIGFRCCQLFYKQYNRYPGCVDTADGTNSSNDEDYCNDDCIRLQPFVQTIVNQYKLQHHKLIQNTLLLNDSHKNDYVTELVRYGNAEIHTIASIVGGVASQEAIKIITQQYIPINNTYIYNGIVSIGAVYKF